jgi:hypothetical protein
MSGGKSKLFLELINRISEGSCRLIDIFLPRTSCQAEKLSNDFHSLDFLRN